MRRVILATVVAATFILSGSAAQAAPAPGSPGIGDAYFPDYGNGGYDVSHYDIRLRYEPSADELSGTTTILARATADLSRFNLDFVLPVSSVRVNGWQASYAREGDHELVVTPARPVLRDQNLTVVVQYRGVPSSVVAAGYTAWKRTADGAQAVGEPEMAWWWYPGNDHPTDKATFDVSVSVPDGVEVISNGVPPRAPQPERVGWTRWSWRTTKPMAPYLAFLVIGQYDLVGDTAPNGQPVINAYSQRLGDLAGAARASIERTAEVIEWESAILGPYPFEAQGGVAGPPDGVNFALENQTRPVYGAGFWTRGSHPYVIAHELAHQWFGDSVSVTSWRDIWLNEGFASYLEWLWSEHIGEGTAQELFDFNYGLHPAQDPFWQLVIADPGPARIFDDAVYDRGAMALHQLRLTVGDDAFFTVLRRWVAEHQYGNGTIEQFMALAGSVSGQELDVLFDAWLFTAGRPALALPEDEAPMGAFSVPGPGAARTAPGEPTSWSKIRMGAELRRSGR